MSGCRDNQYSYDARIGGTYHGAMTYYALRTIEAANYDTDYRSCGTRSSTRLATEGYDQEPQLEGKYGEQAPAAVHVSDAEST